MVEITFISDYVCPFCIVGKAALEAASRETGIPIKVNYVPYELTMAPKPQVDTYHDERRRARYHDLDKAIEDLKLDVHIPPFVVPRPYTTLTFEGFWYAKDHGKEKEYNDLMYAAYFTDEKDIGDIEVLSDLASSIGLDREDFHRAILNGDYHEKELEAQVQVRENYEVRGVPTLYIKGQKIQLQEYNRQEMMEVLRTEAGKEEGLVCSEDGCH